MRHRAISTLVLLALIAAMAVAAADAAGTVRYSGRVATIDPDGAVMILEEMGPWNPKSGTAVVTRRTIGLTPATKYNLFMRVDIPGRYAGDFVEVVLDAYDLSPGDMVTAACLHQDGRLIAQIVTVAELE